MITSVEQLDDLLSAPNDADVEAMRALRGTLLLLGAGGKMGPTLAIRARRAALKAGVATRIIGVSRFSSPDLRRQFESGGIETISADILEPDQLSSLPDAENVIYMAGRKFGSTGGEALTWAMNAYLPAAVAQRYPASRIVAFSSGNIYPLVPLHSGGATENTVPAPIGEYAQSVLARERILEYFSHRNSTPMTILRLNYAVELRYGVLLDIGAKVLAGRPVDVSMPAVNIIWQGDANSVCLRSFAVCQSPPNILNLTGPETLSVRQIAIAFGEHLGTPPIFDGEESSTALLNNAGKCHRLFGYPTAAADQIIEWTAHWLSAGGETLNKPTHFQARDGRF